MPDLEKEEALALFEDGNHSVELVRDWSPEALADLIASINWNYQGAPDVKGALQALYEQRRSEEAHRKRVRRVWGLAVAAAVAAVLIFVLWEEFE
jgi:heterodisulfide reductase subunit B